MTDVTELTNDRGKVHGDFSDVAKFAQDLKDTARTSKNWGLLTDVQKEGLEMILHKIARILVGDPNHRDHWDDIAGYAHITSIRIPLAPGLPSTRQIMDGEQDDTAVLTDDTPIKAET